MQRQVANTDKMTISTLMVPPSVPSEPSASVPSEPVPYRRVVHRWRTVYQPIDQPVAFTPSPCLK